MRVTRLYLRSTPYIISTFLPRVNVSDGGNGRDCSPNARNRSNLTNVDYYVLRILIGIEIGTGMEIAS